MNDLNRLADRIQTLRDNNAQGAINLVTQQLKDIFEQLQLLVPENDLTACIEVFQNSSLLLEEKIEAIDHFLAQLTLKGKYLHFLQTRATEEILTSLVAKVWFNPYNIPGISSQYLCNSWIQLVTNKKITRTSRFTQDLLFESQKELQYLSTKGDPFEARMEAFFNSIYKKFPTSIYELLGEKDKSGLYFERFSFILHLLKNGKIKYDSTTKSLFLNPNFIENQDGETHYE